MKHLIKYLNQCFQQGYSKKLEISRKGEWASPDPVFLQSSQFFSKHPIKPLVTLEPKHRISDTGFKQIAAVHNSMVGHWGLQKCREFLKDPTITDRTITQFIRQCPCCQVMSRLNILIKTHSFTCASYNQFESLHIDHIGPLPVDDKGNSPISVMIDAFSRWVELFPNKYIVER